MRATVSIWLSGLLWVVSPVAAADDEPLVVPRFTDVTAEAGVAVAPSVHEYDTAEVAYFHGAMRRQHYAGVALEDMDRDGALDLLICDIGRVHVFQGDGTGHFARPGRVPALMLRDSGYAAHGLVVGDVTNNGWPDVYVTVERGSNHLFVNHGDWRFSEEGQARGATDPGIGFSANLVDYDRDGDLDVFVCNYGAFRKDRLHLTLQVPGGRAPAGDEPATVLKQRNVLYQNRGDGTFRDVTESAGLGAEDLSLASAFADYDEDGDQDLFVANDFGVNRLYRNNGDGTFTEVTAESGYVDPGYGMSAFWGDVNNDGRLDLWVGNMYSHAAQTLMAQDHAGFARLPATMQTLFRRSLSGNALLVQQADGTFVNEAPRLGVNDGGWAWGSVMADVNNDGWPDLYVANGWTRGAIPSDYCAVLWGGTMEGLAAGARHDPSGAYREGMPPARRLFERQHARQLTQRLVPTESAQLSDDALDALAALLDEQGDLDVDVSHVPRLGDRSWDGYNRNRLFVNPGPRGGPFVSVDEGPLVTDDISRTVATGDIDGDGDLDVVLVSTTAPVKILRNDTAPRRWLVVRLEGTVSNRSAVGTRVIARAGERQWIREVTAGSGFCSHQSLEVEFGFGDLKQLDALEIRWPSGRIQRLAAPRLNQRIKVVEPDQVIAAVAR